jgi:hypothetical protein
MAEVSYPVVRRYGVHEGVLVEQMIKVSIRLSRRYTFSASSFNHRARGRQMPAGRLLEGDL